MPTPDSKYIPKAKGKSKTSKVKRVVVAPTFPAHAKKQEIKPLKKKSPLGDHYVWSR